jgi:preprotein translocase subunit YajC
MNFFNMLGIANAYAAETTASATSAATTSTAAAHPTQGFFSMLPMIIILIGFMYLMVIRPQSKRAKAHRELMSGLKNGDEVITSGGILGKISKVADDVIILEIANGVEIKIQRSAIAANVPKGTVKAA